MLRLLYKEYQDRIAFSAPGLKEPVSSKVLPGGGVVVFRLWSVPLPNSQPESWDDTNCAEAFEAVAEAWDCERFAIVATSVLWIQLTVAEFMSWIDKTPYPPPTFWHIAAEKDGVNERPRAITSKSAMSLTQHYIELEKSAGRQPMRPRRADAVSIVRRARCL
jgi:hypothetical protein